MNLSEFSIKKYLLSKSKALKQYYKDLFGDKHKLIIRYGISVATMAVIFLVTFLLRAHFIQTTFEFNGPLVVANTGISFGALQGQTGLVYFLQCIPVFFSLIAMIHSKNIIFSFGIALVFASGLSNVIDRLIPDYLGKQIPGSISVLGSVSGQAMFVAYNAVIDYWESIGSSSIYNFPDVFIIVGIIIVFLFSLVNGWIDSNRKLREEEAREKAKAAASQEVAPPSLPSN